MPKSSASRLAITLLALSLTANAFAASFQSIEQIFDSVPAPILRELASKKNASLGMTETNRYLGTHVYNQHAQFHAKVDFLEPLPAGGKWRYRIRAVSTPVRWRGGEMDRLVMFYFPEANVPKEGSLAVGSDIVVSGTIGRCEVVNNNGVLRANVDLGDSKLESVTAAPH